MFRSQSPIYLAQLRTIPLSTSAISVPSVLRRTGSLTHTDPQAPPAQKCTHLSPLAAPLTDHSQLIEETITLNLIFATLTDRVKHKSFVCHSYKKHPGVGYPLSPLITLYSPRTTYYPPLTTHGRLYTPSAINLDRPLRSNAPCLKKTN